MSEEGDTYCRLCAEPTPITQLITPTEDVGVSSKITTKMQWINIDITINNLPNTICFSCFDQLERTWTFLHNVRTAQNKLNSIFLKQPIDMENDNKSNEPGKPADKDWEEFQDPKVEIKCEVQKLNNIINNVDTNFNVEIVKTELPTDDEVMDSLLNHEGWKSSDSDNIPLLSVSKKKIKNKKKSKLKFISEEIPIEMALLLTWEDYMCHCGTCDAQCKNIESLRLHSLEIHQQCCSFKCADCGKVLSNHKSFITHARGHKKLLKYSCEYCNKQFPKPGLVKRHRNEMHIEKEFVRTCITCGIIFDDRYLYEDHLDIYGKQMIKKKVSIEKLVCNYCDKEFKSRSNLQQHRLVHTERRREFSCHVCGKMFFTKGTLGTHMLTHDDTKRFKCEYCPMTFRARGNLQSHISLHSGVKPFVCEQCGKSFRVKRHLKSHSIVHTDLMPYACEYCHKAFRFKTRLNLHLRQHTGAKPYSCVHCERDFTNGSNFKKHMKRRHNIDTSRKRYNNVVEHKIEDGVISDQNVSQT